MQGNPAPDLNLASAAGLRNALNAAANQQAALKRLKENDLAAAEQRDFQTALEKIRMGGVPSEIYPNGGPAPGRPTLQTPEPNPAAQGAGQTLTDPNGRRTYFPTPGEKEDAKLTDTNSFIPTGQLGDMLAKFGKKPGSRWTPGDANTLMLAIEKAQPKDGEEYQLDFSGKFLDAQGKPAPVMVGKKTGKVQMLDMSGMGGGDQPVSAFNLQRRGEIPPGTELPIANGATKGGAFALPDKPKLAAKALHFTHDTNQAGDVTTRAFDPETGDLKSTTVAKGIGTAKRDPNAAPREKPVSAAQLRLVVSGKTKALKAANDAYAKATALVGGAGGLPPSDQDMAEAGVALRKAHQQAQLDYEEALGAATGNEIPHNDWADKALADAKLAQPGAAPAAQTAAAPAIADGTTIVNPKTKQRMVLRGGTWQPL